MKNTQQLDITLMAYPLDDLFMYKLINSGIYNNNIYNDNYKNKIEDLLNNHYNFDTNERIKNSILEEDGKNPV